MDLKDKLFWFTAKQLRTKEYIYRKQKETFDYALFLNKLTELYIEAGCVAEVEKLLMIQRVFLE